MRDRMHSGIKRKLKGQIGHFHAKSQLFPILSHIQHDNRIQSSLKEKQRKVNGQTVSLGSLRLTDGCWTMQMNNEQRLSQSSRSDHVSCSPRQFFYIFFSAQIFFQILQVQLNPKNSVFFQLHFLQIFVKKLKQKVLIDQHKLVHRVVSSLLVPGILEMLPKFLWIYVCLSVILFVFRLTLFFEKEMEDMVGSGWGLWVESPVKSH